jgi:DNA-binding NarL/FixJ family response regulator
VTAPGTEGGGGITRCLIVDDQAMVREGFAAVLAAQPGLLVVGQAADGADAVRLARHLRPDVVLMDVRMPVMDGLQAARQILSNTSGPARPRVLMLTTFDLDDYVYEALRAGASGFLLKDATAAELVHAVRVVAAGDALLAPSVTRRLIADFARRPPSGPRFPPAAGTLTQRETEVLRLIAHGLSNAEISGALVSPSRPPRPWPHPGQTRPPRPRRPSSSRTETGLVTPGGSGAARAAPPGRSVTGPAGYQAPSCAVRQRQIHAAQWVSCWPRHRRPRRAAVSAACASVNPCAPRPWAPGRAARSAMISLPPGARTRWISRRTAGTSGQWWAELMAQATVTARSATGSASAVPGTNSMRRPDWPRER